MRKKRKGSTALLLLMSLVLLSCIVPAAAEAQNETGRTEVLHLSSPEISASPSEISGDEDEKTEEEHVHEFPPEWHSDEECHWHECSCGEKAHIEYHSFEWETVKKASRWKPGVEKGVCVVCGYETTREIEYEPGQDGGGFSIWTLLIILAVIAAAVFVLRCVRNVRSAEPGKHEKK